MQIRKARPADKKELARLVLAFHNFAQKNLSKKQADFREFTDSKKMSEETSEQYFTKPEFIVVVADESGSLKGFISGEIKNKRLRVHDKAGYVEKWFVEKDYQNKGIGKELFDRLAQEFKGANCTHIELDTHLENKKAMKIYERLGFTKRLVTFFKLLGDSA